MTSIIFHNTHKVDDLFRLIDNCMGSVYFKDDINKTDLRCNEDIRLLLMEADNNNIIENENIIISDRRDMPKVIDYLLSCNRKPVLR